MSEVSFSLDTAVSTRNSDSPLSDESAALGDLSESKARASVNRSNADELLKEIEVLGDRLPCPSSTGTTRQVFCAMFWEALGTTVREAARSSNFPSSPDCSWVPELSSFWNVEVSTSNDPSMSDKVAHLSVFPRGNRARPSTAQTLSDCRKKSKHSETDYLVDLVLPLATDLAHSRSGQGRQACFAREEGH